MSTVLPNRGFYRSGVRFDCPDCGTLLKDEKKHLVVLRSQCFTCHSDLKLVAVGANTAMVGDARWFRCVKCKMLFMQRRGEVVATTPRRGFKDVTEF